MTCLSASHDMPVDKQVEWVSRRVKIVGCQTCQKWVHQRKPDRFATLSQRSMTGVMFAGMKEDREPWRDRPVMTPEPAVLDTPLASSLDTR